MKRKIIVYATLISLAIVGISLATKAACGNASNAECYSFENGKSCLHLPEVGAGNCNGGSSMQELQQMSIY